MTLSLRQRHRRWIIVLGLILPLVFALGVAARRPIPKSSPCPALASVPQFTTLQWQRDDLWPGPGARTGIRTACFSNPSHPAQWAIELSVKTEVALPDLLVYWLPGTVKSGDPLPANAFLLGAFLQSAPTPLPLPPASRRQDGSLILYSLADNEVVQVSRMFNADSEKP